MEPGGLIIYSTCTFAPEENERVISRVLSRLNIEIKIESAVLPGFEFSPGLKSWEEEDFIEGIDACMRIWPHQNDTGGFFVARLRKV